MRRPCCYSKKKWRNRLSSEAGGRLVPPAFQLGRTRRSDAKRKRPLRDVPTILCQVPRATRPRRIECRPRRAKRPCIGFWTKRTSNSKPSASTHEVFPEATAGSPPRRAGGPIRFGSKRTWQASMRVETSPDLPPTAGRHPTPPPRDEQIQAHGDCLHLRRFGLGGRLCLLPRRATASRQRCVQPIVFRTGYARRRHLAFTHFSSFHSHRSELFPSLDEFDGGGDEGLRLGATFLGAGLREIADAPGAGRGHFPG